MAVKLGRVRRDALRFASDDIVVSAVREMEDLHDLGTLMNSHPDEQAPEAVSDAVRRAIVSGRFSILDDGPP